MCVVTTNPDIDLNQEETSKHQEIWLNENFDDFKCYRYAFRAIDKHILWVFTQSFLQKKQLKLKLMVTKKQMKILNTL